MSNQNTPLHTAVQNGNIEIVKLLLDAGHDPNEANAEGLTPLHIAAQTGNAGIATLLVSRPMDNDKVIDDKELARVNNWSRKGAELRISPTFGK